MKVEKRKAGRPRSDDPKIKNFRRAGQSGRPKGAKAGFDPGTPEGDHLIRFIGEMSLLGASRALIAQGLDVTESTLANWREKFPEIRSALDDGETGAGRKVAAALFRRATGYELKREVVSVKTGGPNGTEETTTTETVHIPPDVKAATFWLERRFPEVWAPKIAGEDGNDRSEIVEVEFEVVPDDDPAKYLPQAAAEPALLQAPEVPGRLGFGSAFKR